MIPPIPPPRPRNAAATRDAMLASARRKFARESYDNVGLREIAGDVGVDPSLVSRYFGSKESLFRAVLQGDDQDMLVGITRDNLPVRLAELLMEQETSSAEADVNIERLLVLLRSASSPKASAIIRKAIDEDILQPIACLLDDPDAELRASLCFAVLMGTSILRETMALAPMCKAEPDALRRRLTALFEAALVA